jgi:glucose/arabinose dehydrogenase
MQLLRAARCVNSGTAARAARCAQIARFAQRVLLSALFTLGLLACDEDTVAPVRGSLEITITGLPSGAAADVSVSGPSAFLRDITATTTLTDLVPGTYTVDAEPVVFQESRYTPNAATQSVTVAAASPAATAAVAYVVSTARLAVNISGLPTGVGASVTVTGPGGFSTVINSTTTFNLLTPGTYTITATDVTQNNTTYRAAPPTQTVTLTASTTVIAANVTYSATTGSLTVTIGGLPTGVNASVTVSGPGGYSQQLTSSQTLTPLPVGDYTITASNVATNLTTHRPDPATQTVSVTGGATATRTVNYSGIALSLRVQQIASGLTNPVFGTAPANDPRLFIVEQPGRIRIFTNGALNATPFLDITNLVAYGGEQGLLSMAFDPAYASNGRLYVYYTDNSGNIAIDRFTAPSPVEVVDPATRVNVITIPHPVYSNHNGGQLMFGPDGFLYAGTGDGGGGGDPFDNGQNINTLLGKMLRLDVSTLPYTIPTTNPFRGATPGADEIWAYGLRNPWRFAFDVPANLLYIADVGQDVIEEINVESTASAGLNYGWRIMEGSRCYNPSSGCNPHGLRLPAWEYTHANGNCSITGGFVYRGTAIRELTGHYLYSDYCTGFLRSFRMVSGSATEHRDWSTEVGALGNVLSFGTDSAGEMYILTAQGRVYRIIRA